MNEPFIAVKLNSLCISFSDPILPFPVFEKANYQKTLALILCPTNLVFKIDPLILIEHDESR